MFGKNLLISVCANVCPETEAISPCVIIVAYNPDFSLAFYGGLLIVLAASAI